MTFEIPEIKEITPCEIHGNQNMFINGRCGVCIEIETHKKNEIIITDIHKKMQHNAGIPQRFRDSTFDNYICDTNEQQRIKTTLMNFEFDKNLLFLGNTGTGKTHLANSLLNKKIKNKKFTNEELDDIKKNPKFNPTTSYYYVKFYNLMDLKIKKFDTFKKMINSKFLIIDEVGTSDSENKNNLLFEIIDERYDNLKHTMLISNLSQDGLKAIISPATYSRIKENFIIFDVGWEDYRLRKNK